MEKTTIRHISIRIEDDLRKEFNEAAKYYGYSMNKAMLRLVCKFIEQYKKEIANKTKNNKNS